MRTVRDLLQLQEQFDRAFREARAWRQSPATEPGFAPETDVTQDDQAYTVTFDLPGASRTDLKVYAEGGALIVSGHRGRPGREQARLVRGERQHGRFSRVVPLPSDADFGRVTAKLQQGVLRVIVHRVRPGDGGRIEITVD